MSGFNVTLTPDRERYSSERDSIFDALWVKNTFIMGTDTKGKYSTWLNKNRYFSSADVKFGSTAPGMAMAVNPKPQFTRYADIRRPGMVKMRDTKRTTETGIPSYSVISSGGELGLGYGRYYSEAIDDPQQRIFLRFGEPQYMSVLFWLGKSFDIHKAVLFRRGFISQTFINAVNFITKFFKVMVAPWLSALDLVLDFVFQPNRFVSLRDNMYTYWATVGDILNSMFVRRTKVPHLYKTFDRAADNNIGSPLVLTESFIENLSKMVPGLINKRTGQISVFALGLRAQAAYNQTIYDNIKRSTYHNITTDETGYNYGVEYHDTYFTNDKGKAGMFTHWLLTTAFESINESTSGFEQQTNDLMQLNSVLSKGGAEIRDVGEEEQLPYLPAMNERSLDSNGVELDIKAGTSEYGESADGKDKTNLEDKAKNSIINRYAKYIQAEITAGAAFAIFNVDTTGSIGESFSNSSDNNPLEGLFNSVSSKVRTFTAGVSNFTEIPGVGEVIGTAFDAAGVAASNISFGLANPLLALMYGVSLNLPKHWASASASLPRASYKMRLTSPYGNSYSQMFNMYFPLAMLMAGAMPRSVGIGTYVAPFMCSLYDRGRVNILYGMIDSFSVTRGTSNLAFTKSGQPNAIDVDFSVADMDEIIAVDMNSGGIMTQFFDKASPNFSDSTMTTYINTITGVDVYSMFYTIPSMRMKLAEKEMAIQTMFKDDAALASFTVNAIPIIGDIGRGIFGNNVNIDGQDNNS